MVLFVLDYDNTFSVNPDMWLKIAKIVNDSGYRIVGATARNKYELITDQRYFSICDAVIYCAGNSKNKVLQNFHMPDKLIWIDDDPQYIIQSYTDIHNTMYDPGEGVEITADFYEPHIQHAHEIKGLFAIQNKP